MLSNSPTLTKRARVTGRWSTFMKTKKWSINNMLHIKFSPFAQWIHQHTWIIRYACPYISHRYESIYHHSYLASLIITKIYIIKFGAICLVLYHILFIVTELPIPHAILHIVTYLTFVESFFHIDHQNKTKVLLNNVVKWHSN